MSFLKRIAEVIVRSSGQSLPLNMQNGGTLSQSVRQGGKSGFGGFLANLQQRGQLQMPTPPVPPADLNDLEAQRKYNQALLSYNQRFQAYHTQVMSGFLQRILMMQQFSMQQQRIQQQQQRNASSGNGLTPGIGGVSSIGGIIGTDADI